MNRIVGEQLSLFGLTLPANTGEQPEILLDLLEISTPKHQMNQGKDKRNG